MTEYVRVKSDATGHEFTVRANRVKPGLTALEKSALGRDRLPAPPKYRVPLGDGPAPSSVFGTRPPAPAPEPAPETENGHEADEGDVF